MIYKHSQSFLASVHQSLSVILGSLNQVYSAYYHFCIKPMPWIGGKWSHNWRLERFWDQNVTTAYHVWLISRRIYLGLSQERYLGWACTLIPSVVWLYARRSRFGAWNTGGPTVIHPRRLLGLKKVIQLNDPPTPVPADCRAAERKCFEIENIFF